MFAHTNVTHTNKRTGFDYHGVHVENHRIFLNAYTQLQIDAIKFLEGTLGDVRQTEDGYYIMSPIADIVYQVMHFIAHFDDASASLSLKFLVDFGVTLQNYYDIVSPEALKEVLKTLKIVDVFCLMLSMVETVMSLKFERYRFSSIPSEDEKAIFQLIMRRPKEFVPLVERGLRDRIKFYVARYKQFDRLFKYLPISRYGFLFKAFKEIVSTSFRRLFKIPADMPYSTYIKNIVKN